LDHPKNAPASANESPSPEPSYALSVTRGDGKRRSRRGGYPLASASLYEPACERTWWWISLRCPWCKSVHLHRVRHEEDAGGVRRTGCGRRVYVRDPDRLPERCQLGSGSVTAPDRAVLRLAGRLAQVISENGALRDGELLAILGCELTVLNAAIPIAVHWRKVDRCGDYLVAVPPRHEGKSAA
jgi:hypothetical protein